MSPSLIQGYVSAAMKISRLAVGDRTLAPSQVDLSPRRRRWRRTATSKACRSARAAACSSATRSRSTPSTSSRSAAAAAGGGGRRAAAPTSRSTARRSRCRTRAASGIPVTAGPHTIGVAVVDRQRGAGVDDAYSDFRAANNGFTAGGGVQNVAIIGPFNPTGTGDTPSRRRIFVCRPGDGRGRRRPARGTILSRAGAPRLSRHRSPAREIDTLMAFYQQGRARRRLRDRHPARAGAHPRRAAVPLPHRGGAGGRRRRRRLSHQRSRAGVAPVVLPVEQHSGRRAARPRRPRAGCAIRRRCSSRSGGCWPIRRPTRSSRTSPASGCTCASSPTCRPKPPGFDDNLRQSFRRETEMLFGTIVREDRTARRPARRRLHVRRRAAGAALRHPERPRQPLPPRDARCRQPAARPARPRQHADGHVGRHAHLAGDARQVDSREPARRAAAGAAAGRRDEPRRGRGDAKTTTLRQRLELHRANPVCASCHKIMDPLGLRAGELRPDRRLARDGRPRRRSTPPASSPTARRSTGRRTCGRPC